MFTIQNPVLTMAHAIVAFICIRIAIDKVVGLESVKLQLQLKRPILFPILKKVELLRVIDPETVDEK